MMIVRSAIIYSVLSSWFLFASAFAASRITLNEYSSSKIGISFKYPDGWATMTPEEVKQKTQGRLEITKGTVLFLVNEHDADRNMNLRIIPAPVKTANASQLRQLEEDMDKNYPKQFPGFRKVSSRIVTVSGLTALEYMMDTKRIDKVMRQKFLLVINEGQGYALTFTAPAETFAEVNASCYDVVATSFSLKT